MDKLHVLIRDLEIEKLKSILHKEIDLTGTMLSVCSSQSTNFETQLDLLNSAFKLH